MWPIKFRTETKVLQPSRNFKFSVIDLYPSASWTIPGMNKWPEFFSKNWNQIVMENGGKNQRKSDPVILVFNFCHVRRSQSEHYVIFRFSNYLGTTTFVNNRRPNILVNWIKQMGLPKLLNVPIDFLFGVIERAFVVCKSGQFVWMYPLF